MRPFLRNTVFFIGWLLSPFTFWNDAFVNIPLSYLMANVLIRFIRLDFLLLVLISYWVTNALGLYMMYSTTRQIFNGREQAGERAREILKLIATTAVYSLLLVALGKFNILRPVSF